MERRPDEPDTGVPTSPAHRVGLEEETPASETIRGVMSPCPRVLGPDVSAQVAAELMRGEDIGDVLVIDEDHRLVGILTDRDIVVRILAEGRDLQTPIADVCSRELTTIGPDEPIRQAVNLMRERAIRRLPVVENGQVVGMLTLGDVALERDSRSTLADISAAPPNT